VKSSENLQIFFKQLGVGAPRLCITTHITAIVEEIAMTTKTYHEDSTRYQRCIEVSRRINWDLEADVIRGRCFDFRQDFLPDRLSGISTLTFLTETQRRALSQIQGRTYANTFGLAERFVTAKMIELAGQRALGEQTELAALVGFTQEEIKHQMLFHRIEGLAAAGMPDGYRFVADADEVATTVLEASTWSVLALTLAIELFTQTHYNQSIGTDESLSPLFKDVFLYHWREESQHAILDELELRREHAGITIGARADAVEDLIGLISSLDQIVTEQADADATYFADTVGSTLTTAERARTQRLIRAAYRSQFVLSGLEHPRFMPVLSDMLTATQMTRLTTTVEAFSTDITIH
jgi:hypothetical protein